MVQVPRWIVYFQAALLGLVATTFFIFGIMVGSLTSKPGPTIDSRQDIRVTGSVYIMRQGERVPDAGSVVFLLPETPAEISRQHPETVRPDSFEPLENPTIDWIRHIGGAVIRTNVNGKFEVYGRPGKYNLLVISKVARRSESTKLPKPLVAIISQYFLPVEKLIEDRQYHWQSLILEQESIELNEMIFKSASRAVSPAKH